MPLPGPLEVACRVAEVLEDLGLRYLVGGALASSLHGVPRATDDADILAELPRDRVDALIAALGDNFYVDHDGIGEAIERNGSFNILHLETMVKIDVLVFHEDPPLVEEMRRRQRYPVDAGAERQLYFASAEDIVLQKLAWKHEGEGADDAADDRHFTDAVGVLKVQGKALDRAYLSHWAEVLEVTELLERALAAATG